MGEHPLLPPLQQTFEPGDAEAHVRAVGRRFPALCKLLATLITASPPKSHESDVSYFGCFFSALGLLFECSSSEVSFHLVFVWMPHTYMRSERDWSGPVCYAGEALSWVSCCWGAL